MTKERNDLLAEIKKEETDLSALENNIKTHETDQKQSLSSCSSLEIQHSRAESLKKLKDVETDKKDLIKLKNSANKVE